MSKNLNQWSCKCKCFTNIEPMLLKCETSQTKVEVSQFYVIKKAGGNKRTCLLKQTWKSELKVCLYMHDFVLPPDVKVLKVVLKFFRKYSDKIRSIPPSVFFEKSVLKLSGKFLENHLQ